jgi:DNA-binding CsgD family transcriptional regulator
MLVAPQHRVNSAESALASIISCQQSCDIGTALLQPVTDMIEAEAATILDFKLNRAGDIELAHSWSHNLPVGCHEQYTQRYFRSDPMVGLHLRDAMRRPEHSAPTEVFLVNNVAELCDQVQTLDAEDYYRQFWTANELNQMLVMTFWLPALRDHGIIIALHRRNGSQPYGNDVIDHASHIAPAISVALGNILMAGELEKERRIRTILTEYLDPFGVTLLDDEDRIVFSNARAEKHWITADIDPALRRFIIEDSKTMAARPRRIGPVEVISRPLSEGQGRIVLTSSILTDAEIVWRCNAYGISAREAEVVGLVCDGLSNPEIATMLKISVNTVENHMRSIFEKTNVENRMRLMRLILGH